MKITNLKVNRINNPLGFNLGKPTLSYIVEDTKAKKQVYAQIMVALDEMFENVVYDSYKQEGLNSLAFELPINLKPCTKYYWKVSVLGDNGEFGTSDIAWFETGKLRNNWEAKWITSNIESEKLPVFIKNIDISKKIKNARAYVCGLGLYELEINGNKVGDEYFAPGFNNYDKWIQYQTYDITDSFVEGINNIKTYIGKGWYKGRYGIGGKGNENIYGDKYLFLAEIKVEYEDGTTETFITDKTWQCSESKIIDGNIYDGEIVDMTLDNSKVYSVSEIDFGYEKLTERRSLPVKIKKKFVPVSIIKTPIGETIIDVGQNMTGWLEFTTNAPKGHELHLEYCEILQDGSFYRGNLGTAKAEFRYISDGEKRTVSPKFTYYGFRYVKVENWHDELNLEDFTACAVYSDLEETGEIQTGDSLVNKLFSNIMWSQRDNFLEIPTDCPQRAERLGWTGDAQVFAGTACFNMDSYAFLSKFAYDIYEEQKTTGGGVPEYVPTLNKAKGFSSGWGDVATVIPWTLYRQYGDKSILEQQFESMKMWVEYIRKQDEESGNKKLWATGFHFGDWLALDGDEGGFEGGTEKEFIASAYYFYSTTILAKTCEVLGKIELFEEYTKLAEEIRKAIIFEYYAESGRLGLKNQTAYILSLFMDIAPEYRERTANDFAKLLKKDKNHLKTGFIGTPYICRALSDNGYNELAYTLLLNKDLPSWLYAVNMGATTVWERWNSVMPDGKMNPAGMNSLNHYAYGAVAEWMYRNMAGINEVEAGFKKAIIRPYYDWRLNNVSCYLNTASGKFESLWKITKDGEILVEITTPFNTETDLILNDSEAETIYINDKKLTKSGFKYIKDGKNTIISVEAGTYYVSYTPTKDYIMTYNLEMTLGELLANTKAKEIFKKYWPALGNANAPFMFAKTPLYLKGIPPLRVDDENLVIVESELKKIIL